MNLSRSVSVIGYNTLYPLTEAIAITVAKGASPKASVTRVGQ